MSRLPIVNFAGVIALAVLCVFQWRRDRDLNLEIRRLEGMRIENEATLTRRQKELTGAQADLASFKEIVAATRSELSEARDKLRAAESGNVQLRLERDQVRATVTNWMEAVRIRDERLGQANQQIEDLASRLNASVQQFNELATNYNAAVEEANRLRAAPK